MMNYLDLIITNEIITAHMDGSCVNTKDIEFAEADGQQMCKILGSCVDHLKLKDCDNKCNLCPCSTANGINEEHCNGHGVCEASCTTETCLNARCKCDPGWYGDKCESLSSFNGISYNNHDYSESL